MRTALYEPTPGSLAALMNTGLVLAKADLYTITLSGGTVLRYTSADRAYSVGGNTFLLGPTLKRSRTKTKVGITVDTMDIQVSPGPGNATINSRPICQFIALGGLDNAEVKLERVFMATPSSVIQGGFVLFVGRVSDVKGDRSEVTVNVSSETELLNAKVPRNLYAPGCTNTLYDRACGLNKASFSGSGTVLSGATRAQFNITTSHAQSGVDGYFDLGVIVFTSGPNAGVARTIRKYTVTPGPTKQVTLIAPLPFTPTAGDTFSPIYPGCNKTQAQCTSKFANLIRFRGFPYIPAPETAT